MFDSIHFHSFLPFLDNHAFTIILMMLLDFIIVVGIIAYGSKNVKIKPSKSQNLVEWAIVFVMDYADSIIGPKAHKYYTLLIMLFFYILVGNMMGLVPGLVSPTSMLSVTVALAITVFVTEHMEGIKDKGVIKYFAHFAGGEGIPVALKPFMFFIEVVSELSRPLSLSFRLFGNIMAKEILLGVLVLLVTIFYPVDRLLAMQMPVDGMSTFLASFSFILRPLIIVLGTLVSIIQAGVFTLLTAIYISGAVASHEHAEEH